MEDMSLPMEKESKEWVAEEAVAPLWEFLLLWIKEEASEMPLYE